MIEFIEMKRKSRLKKDKKTNKRIDVFFVYFVYFVVFITLIQISEIEFVKIFCEEKLRMRFRFDLIGIYAPLFLSTILIDVTYRLGKRQNELVTQGMVITPIEECLVYKGYLQKDFTKASSIELGENYF